MLCRGDSYYTTAHFTLLHFQNVWLVHVKCHLCNHGKRKYGQKYDNYDDDNDGNNDDNCSNNNNNEASGFWDWFLLLVKSILENFNFS